MDTDDIDELWSNVDPQVRSALFEETGKDKTEEEEEKKDLYFAKIDTDLRHLRFKRQRKSLHHQKKEKVVRARSRWKTRGRGKGMENKRKKKR